MAQLYCKKPKQYQHSRLTQIPKMALIHPWKSVKYFSSRFEKSFNGESSHPKML